MVNTGSMRNKVIIYKNVRELNGVGEIENSKELFLTLMAEVKFYKTVDSESKFDSSWSNRLLVQTRYAKSMMHIINNRDGFTFEYQGKVYRLINYDMWNQVQKFITFYIESDSNGKI